MQLIERVRASGDAGFEEWFGERDAPGESQEYLVGQLMSFLGVAPRAYQYWERNAEELGYPVPTPRRKRLWPHVEILLTRVYSPAEFVAVAKWYYERKEVRREKSDVHGVAIGAD